MSHFFSLFCWVRKKTAKVMAVIATTNEYAPKVLTLQVTTNSRRIQTEEMNAIVRIMRLTKSIYFISPRNKMYKLTYAENNNLVKKNVGGWGGTVGSNTRGDFDKKGWTQAGGLVITPTDQLMGPVSACNCGGVPLGGMGLEQAANVSRCCHGQPPVYNSNIRENWDWDKFFKGPGIIADEVARDVKWCWDNWDTWYGCHE